SDGARGGGGSSGRAGGHGARGQRGGPSAARADGRAISHGAAVRWPARTCSREGHATAPRVRCDDAGRGISRRGEQDSGGSRADNGRGGAEACRAPLRDTAASRRTRQETPGAVIAAGPTDYWHDGSFITAAQNM